MAKPFNEWTVLPHGKLRRLEDNLLCVTGLLRMPPMGEVQRRMTIVRLKDGRLVIYSAIALAEPQMKEVEAFGTPVYLIVPSAIHRMDTRAWKSRYPSLTVIAPPGAREQADRLVTVDATSVDFGDPNVHFVTVPGTAEREAALIVESVNGTTLILNDVIFNLPNRPGISGWFFKKLGLTSDEPHVAPLIAMRLIEDKRALRAQLESWSHLPHLRRVIIAHGDIIGNDAPQVLGRIAGELAA